MNNDNEINEVESTANKHDSEKTEEGATTEVEFKLTVRKLEMPVRPRGVLAE